MWKALIAAVIIISACSSHDDSTKQNFPDNDQLIVHASGLISTGDLILRTGKDYSSDQVRQFSSTDQTYSHAGVAVVEEGEIFIYHIEPERNNRVRKEPLRIFCDPSLNRGFGIARYSLNAAEKASLVHFMKEKYHSKISFDLRFDLSTDQEMYCSELIKKGIDSATAGKIVINTYRLSDQGKHKMIKKFLGLTDKEISSMDVVPIDLLYLNDHCQLIRQYVYSR